MAKSAKKEIKKGKFVNMYHLMRDLENECGLMSFIGDIEKDEINYEIGKIVVNNKKETVVLIPAHGDKTIVVKPTNGVRKYIDKNGKEAEKQNGEIDTFDAYTGVSVAIFKHLTGLTCSRYERKYGEKYGVPYEEVCEALLTSMGVDRDTYEKEFDEKVDSYSFEISIGDEEVECLKCEYYNDENGDCEYDELCDCDCCDDYDEYDYDGCDCECYEEDEVDPMAEKLEEVKKMTDTIAKALGKENTDYSVEIRELNGMPGIAIMGDDDELGLALSRMLGEYLI